MLSTAKIRASRAEYYLATLDTEARRARGALIEPDAYWLGAACERLGLPVPGSGSPGGAGEGGAQAPVLASHVRRVLSGHHPVTGEVLLGPHSQGRVVGAYDCTFSVPKSVSILQALGDPEYAAQVREAHRVAVSSAVGYLEAHAPRLRRRGPDGQRSLEAEGFVAVAFPHGSSRAPDPHLHTHVLIANLAVDSGGTWQALDARRLYLEMSAAAHLCEAQLRAELTTRLGVSWREMRGSFADLAGVSSEAVRAYSRRSQAIETLLRDSGLEGPRAASLAAEASRPPKVLGVSKDELVSQWRERSWRLGVSSGVLRDVAGRRLVGAPPGVRANWREEVLADVTARSSGRSFTRRDLIKARCRCAPDGLGAGEVLRDVDRLLGSDDVVERGSASTVLQAAKLRRVPGDGVELRYATAGAVAAERRILDAVRESPRGVTVLSYEPGARLEALDACSAAAAAVRASGEARALAPGRTAARSFEALTGVETCSRREDLAALGGWRVVVDAHRLSTADLEAVLAPVAGKSGRGHVLLLVPAPELGRDPLLAELARAGRRRHVAAARTQAAVPSETQLSERAQLGREPRSELVFGDVAVLAAGTPLGAREAAFERAARSGAVLVAGDEAIARRLRQRATPAVKVMSAMQLGEMSRTQQEPLPPVVVLGGASELRMGALRLERLDRCHVLVAPDVAGGGGSEASPGELARIAEAVQPAYLRRALGVRRDDPSDRAAWRESAAIIESYRRGLSVDGRSDAFASPSRDLGAASARQAAVAALGGPTRGRPPDPTRGRPPGPDLSLGR